MKGPDDETVARMIREHLSADTIAGAASHRTPHWVPEDQRVDDDYLDPDAVAEPFGADLVQIVDPHDPAPLWDGTL